MRMKFAGDVSLDNVTLSNTEYSAINGRFAFVKTGVSQIEFEENNGTVSEVARIEFDENGETMFAEQIGFK